MYYVYILKSEKDAKRYYIGFTNNLPNRIQEHNNNESIYSKRHSPWKLETYLAFKNKDLAIQFEKYLKVGSGHAFLKKRLIPKMLLRK